MKYKISIIDRILRKRQQFDIEDDLRNASRSIPNAFLPLLATTAISMHIQIPNYWEIMASCHTTWKVLTFELCLKEAFSAKSAWNLNASYRTKKHSGTEPGFRNTRIGFREPPWIRAVNTSNQICFCMNLSVFSALHSLDLETSTTATETGFWTQVPLYLKSPERPSIWANFELNQCLKTDKIKILWTLSQSCLFLVLQDQKPKVLWSFFQNINALCILIEK